MKIVFLSDDFPPQSFGGAGISTYDIARGVSKAGHEVSVVTTVRNKSESGLSEYKGLKIYKIESNYHERWRAYLGLYNPPALRKLKRILEEVRPDVVHVNNIHYHLSYHSIKLSKQYANKVIFTARDAMTFSFGKLETSKYKRFLNARLTWFDHIKQAKKRWNPFRNIIIRYYLSCADVKFAVSNALKKALEENKIHGFEVMHTGIDISDWQISDSLVAEFKTKYNLINKKAVLFSGRLSVSKGGKQAILALREIIKKMPDVVLFVVGGIDAYTQIMKREAEKLGIEENVIFTGWLDRKDIKIATASIDVVLVPSICFDAFPRAVLEAFAVGKPVVATCYGGASEIISDGLNGYIINPFDIGKMASAISDLLNSPEKMSTYGSAAKDSAERQFDSGAIIARLISVYEGTN